MDRTAFSFFIILRPDDELLFFTGIFKHFNMSLLMEKFAPSGRSIGASEVWSHLDTLYDVSALVSALSFSQLGATNEASWDLIRTDH